MLNTFVDYIKVIVYTISCVFERSFVMMNGDRI